ncbi:coatomer subunit zeta [Acrasis kona]|uniref:Coatomer subunit zeta n=1 Tax=Acrasis kona TaxID=1008807 RepID=A0AAW2ZBK1_9EUKA
MDQYIHQIKAIIVLDNEGSKMYSKYYTQELKGQQAKQQQLEKSLFQKTQKTPATTDPDIIQADKYTVVYCTESDLWFYVVGASDENELILNEVITSLTDALQLIFKSQLQKRTFLENFDLIVLAFNEVVDDGIIMEVDANTIADRVIAIEGGTGGSKGGSDDPLTQAVEGAKNQFTELANSLFSF